MSGQVQGVLQHRLRVHLRPIPWLAAAAHMGLGLWVALTHSGAADELGAHMPSGHLYWSTGTFSGGLGNFAFGQLWVSCLAALVGLDYPLFTEQGLIFFRLPNLLLGAATVLAASRLAAALAPDRPDAAAAVTAILTALEPNLRAHGALATVDMTLAGFVLLAVLALHQAVRQPAAWRFALGGLAVGAALGTKVQALLLLPLALIWLATSVARARRPHPGWLLVLVVPWLLLHLVYLDSSPGWAPEAWLYAARQKLEHAGRGHFAYFLGSYSSEGWWYYFPVVIALKTPLPALGLVCMGCFGLRTRGQLLWAALPAAAFLGLAMAGRVNIGLRHVLVVLPFLYVIAGCGVVHLLGPGRGVLRSSALALLALTVLSAARTANHPFAYFNLAAGGPEGGHRHVVQANYDWGLHDGQLRQWIVQQPLSDRLRLRINPDPGSPTSGLVVVNANALYGIINGGEAAYPWLRSRTPDARIAWTWFVYDLGPAPAPDEQQVAARAAVRNELASLPALSDRAQLRLLARAHLASQSPARALEVVDKLLHLDPSDEASLALGGEAVVRWRLGVLRFDEPRSYLGEKAPVGVRPSPRALAAATRALDVRDPVFQVLERTGTLLQRQGDTPGASDAWQRALAIRPDDADLQARLSALGGEAR